MRLLITRPQAQAEAWVQDLRAAGLDAEALPLLATAALDDPRAVRAAWADPAGWDLIVAVSPNAVQHALAARPPGLPWPPGGLLGAPGPGTARAWAEGGAPPSRLRAPGAQAPRHDTEALWALLAAERDWRGARVLILRGTADGAGPQAAAEAPPPPDPGPEAGPDRGVGREWLGEVLARAGAQVHTLACYRRGAPAAPTARLQALAADAAGLAWVFSSREALEQLGALGVAAGLAPAEAPWTPWRAGRALATHPRIAAAAEAAGFGPTPVLRPQVEALIAWARPGGPSDRHDRADGAREGRS